MLIMTGLRSDEAKGLLESQLAGEISRSRMILERFIIGTIVTALLLVLGGASFGLIPRATIAVTWFIYRMMYFTVLLSDALKIPQWMLNIRPFIGTPRVPYQAFNASVFGYLAASIIFVVIGMIGLRNRECAKIRYFGKTSQITNCHLATMSLPPNKH